MTWAGTQRPSIATSKWLAAILLATVACPGPSAGNPVPVSHEDSSSAVDVLEFVYLGSVQKGWKESGSATRDFGAQGPAKVQFGDAGRWVFTRAQLGGPYGALVFRVKEPEGDGEFLQVSVASATGRALPAVKLKPDHCTALTAGWMLVRIPMQELDPANAQFDTIVFEPFRPSGSNWMLFDGIAFTKSGGGPDSASVARQGASVPAPGIASPATGQLTRIRVACDAAAVPISPFIYGIAAGEKDASRLGATVRRWGGNPTSRYNWETHSWNTANDWFFENQNAPPYEGFFTPHGTGLAITIPLLGWVAKDGTSYSFPVSAFGPQEKSDPWRPDVGNGVATGGRGKIPPGPETRTSVPAPPDWATRWVSAIGALDAKNGHHGVYEYILDNEPMLWSTTHRDVHPDPVGYDELLDRSVKYASAIRDAAPDALIAGPAEWGWSSYFYSAKDVAPGGGNADRRAHRDVPLVPWYLQKMRESERSSGKRLLDVLDLHYYPQASNVYGGGAGGSDRSTQLLRLRSTRSLWDPTYVDESWIKEPIRLLPRMKEWVEENYPGRGISIGEWNFGGEKDITGALATAEALGRFAQFGVTSAFYWNAPPAGSPSSFGFLAFRNFDGRGGHFLDWFVPAATSGDLSVFVSRDKETKHIVVVAINMAPSTEVAAELDLSSCGKVVRHETYAYDGTAGFASSGTARDASATVHQALAPWSITVLDVTLGAAAGE